MDIVARPPGWVGGGESPTSFQSAVIAVVSSLEAGDVLTYADVAIEAGHPGAGQAVANVLRRFDGLPWWRVIPSSGRLYRSHLPTQGPLLREDGLVVGENRHVLPPSVASPGGSP